MRFVDHASNITNFILRDLPSSPAGIRLIDAGVKLGGVCGHTQVYGLDFQNLGKAAKTHDTISRIPKFIESVETLVNAWKKYDAAKKTDSAVRILFATIEVVGNGAASMKFFVEMGMSFYVGKTHLIYIKSICSVVLTGKLIYDGFIKTPANEIEKGKQEGFRKDIGCEVLIIASSLCLNTMGVLVEQVSPEAFEGSGCPCIPKATWPVVAMVGSVATVVKEFRKGYRG